MGSARIMQALSERGRRKDMETGVTGQVVLRLESEPAIISASQFGGELAQHLFRANGERTMADSKVAIVTGAARPWGLGREIAMQLADKGFDVAIADVREEWGAEAAETIVKQTGRHTLYIRTDVSKRAEVTAMVDRVVAELGRVDVLVNDAAIGINKAFEDFTDEDFHRVIGVNLLGAMLCAQAVVKPMKNQRYGRIVNIASSAPFMPPPAKFPVSLYNASKGGVIAFTKSAALELARYNIVVSVVAVGGMATGMGLNRAPKPEELEYSVKNVYQDSLPFGRLIEPREMAEVVVDVATARSHVFCGQVIHANGGRIMP
jgi:NAD(P)-dependent dehydrogenase (short-subunit alcohol dehydrogenase family)